MGCGKVGDGGYLTLMDGISYQFSEMCRLGSNKVGSRGKLELKLVSANCEMGIIILPLS